MSVLPVDSTVYPYGPRTDDTWLSEILKAEKGKKKRRRRVKKKKKKKKLFDPGRSINGDVP